MSIVSITIKPAVNPEAAAMSPTSQDLLKQAGPVRGGTVDYLTDHLREGILRGRYAPGQRLIEADLTRDLGVSRGPLREAFRRLSAEGLLEKVPHRGAMVRRLSHREMKEFFQIRMALEALAAQLAAANMHDGEIRDRFETAIAPIWSEQPRVPGAPYLAENNRFHQALVEASGNQQLLTVTQQLRLPLIMFQVGGMLDAAVIESSVNEHRQIARLVLAGNGAAAASQAEAHLRRACEVVDGMPANLFRG